MADTNTANSMEGLRVEGVLEEAQSELKTWMTKVERADDMKARLLLEKLEEEEQKKQVKQEMMACVEKQKECQEAFTQSMKAVQDEMQQLLKNKQDLLEKLRRYQAEMEAKRAQSTQLRRKFKVFTQIPDTDVNFLSEKKEARGEGEDGSQLIRGLFTISQVPAVLLKGGQALITFEKDKVASQVLKSTKCSVSCEDSNVNVKPKKITLDSAVKYEIILDVSRKDLEISNIPSSLPEDRMKDRLEISFSKPSMGGGEVENVEYDQTSGTARITFLHSGVAEQLAMRGSYRIRLDFEVKVKVGPTYKYQLNKFQTFCCTTNRTVLIDDIDDVEDEEDLQDHLEIHFQKPSNSGGEIESIKYISGGKSLQAFFCEDKMDSGL